MKKRESELLMKVVIISLVVGILAGGITAFSVMELNEKDKTSTGELIKEFYEAELEAEH